MLCSQVPDLSSLLIDDSACIFEVAVDQFAVLNVDKRQKEDCGGGDKRNAPLWHEFDQEVGAQGGSKGLESVSR